MDIPSPRCGAVSALRSLMLGTFLGLSLAFWCGAAIAATDSPPGGNPGVASATIWARDSCVTGTCHGQWGADARIYHKPLRDGPCTDCHVPDDTYDPDGHDIFAFTFPDLRTQCLACHEAVAKTLAGTEQVHKPADVGVCERCHDPHGNREELFIIPATGGVEGSGRGLWLSRGLNPQCVSCHGAQPFGEQDASRTEFRDGENNLHRLHLRGVDREIECVQCHEPHAGGQGKLLRSGLGGRWWVQMTFIQQAWGGTCQTSCHLMPRSYRR